MAQELVTLHYACADDVTLNTTDFNDAQVLLTIAEDFASQVKHKPCV